MAALKSRGENEGKRGTTSSSRLSSSPPLQAPARMSSFESAHVHSIYDSIASDFSRTRHTQWPFVHSFLSGLPVVSFSPSPPRPQLTLSTGLSGARCGVRERQVPELPLGAAVREGRDRDLGEGEGQGGGGTVAGGRGRRDYSCGGVRHVVWPVADREREGTRGREGGLLRHELLERRSLCESFCDLVGLKEDS